MEMQNPEGWGPNNYTDQTNRYNDVSPSSSLSQVPHHDGTPATPLYEYTTQPTKNIGPGTGLLYYNKHVDGPGPDESNEPHVIVTQSLPPSDSIRSALHFYALLLTLVLPLVALIVWGVYMKNEHHVFATLAGTVIGGHLEQTQAKAIDFVASAILVPLVMTVFNYTWFACARVCVVNEASTIDLNDSRGVSLHTLSTASTQSGGSYSPLVLWSLVKGRTWRLCTLGLVVLASAIGASALSNIIAYESFSEDIASSDPRTLRSLSDAIIEISPFGEQEYGFSNDEQILAAQNVSSMFNGISFVAAALDSEGGYIGTNATEASMNDLDASISSLNDVPGYRLTADCTPTVLEPDIGFTILTSGSGLVEIIVQANFSEDIRTAFNLSDGWRQYSSTYQYLGSVADIFFDIVLYNQILTFYKGVMTPDITTLVYFETAYTNNSIQTDFGLVEATYENVSTYTSTTESLTRYDMEAYASWAISNSTFTDTRVPYSSHLSDWATSLTATRSASPLADFIFDSTGAGYNESGFYNPPNFTLAANNIVYASGEIERILYNVAAQNSSRDLPEYFYNVTGTVDKEFYRITYVPALLLVSLICILLCALITMAWVWSVRDTISWKTFRQVNNTRLVIDSLGGGLVENAAEFRRLGSATDMEIMEWAEKYYLAYGMMHEEKEGIPQVAIRLHPFGNGNI